MPQNRASLYRVEALQRHQTTRVESSALRLDPAWTDWSYWLLLSTVASALAFAAVGTLHEYARGAAVIQIDGRQELTAPAQATVREVLAKPGQRVRAGTPLVHYYVAQERDELARVQRQFDGLLLRTLRDPLDAAARAELTAVSAARELAEARVAERTLLAPGDGVVSDVRVRAGQAVDPGDPTVTLTTAQSSGRVLAAVPAHYRPLIRAGLSLRLELFGFRFAYQELRVETVSEEALGPAELRRFLGPESADTIHVDGPVILVGARLPNSTFSASGERFHYHHGMVGNVQIRVRTASILTALIPGLRDLVRGSGE